LIVDISPVLWHLVFVQFGFKSVRAGDMIDREQRPHIFDGDLHHSVSWDIKALGKRCNPDVSTKMALPDHGRVQSFTHGTLSREDVTKNLFEGGV